MDDLAGQGEGESASAETPAAPAIDIEALKAQLKAELSSEYDSRISGLQTALNKKDAEAKAARERARELEMSGMTQDEKDALEWEQTNERIAALSRENALLKLQSEYPDLVPIYQQMIEATDVKAQLELLANYKKALTTPPTQTPAPEPELAIPGVDPNNPPSLPPLPTADAPMSPYGQPWTKELADRVLKSVSSLRPGN
jgi:hypothetical protein